ncbi:MAG TPA: oligosaccharide flippase family protein [bacterium]|nr:oligosaccharide flippase family protein [bacterium]
MLQRIIRNTLWRSLADVIARLGSALFWVLLARYLGAGIFGALSFALALMGFFELVSSLGLGSVLTRDAAQDPGAASRYFGHMLMIGMASAVAGAFLMVATAWAVRPDPATLRIVMVLALLLPLTSVAYWSRSMLAAAEKMQYISFGTLTENGLLIVLGLGLLLTGHGLQAVTAALVVSKLASTLLLFHLARRRAARPVWCLERGMAGYILRQVPLFLAIAVFNGLFWSVTVIMVTWLQGEVAAGYFSAAFKLISYVLLFAVAFSQALFPVAARLAQQDRALYFVLLRRALYYLVMLFIGVALLLSLLARPIILLLYGPGMAGAIPVLQSLAWMAVPYGIIPVLAYTLVSHHHQRRDLWANLAGAATVVAGNLVLIPVWSAAGGALAMVAGACVFAAVEFGSVCSLLYPLTPERGAWALGASAALLALTLVLLRHASLALSAGAGCGVYAAALWLSRAISRQDLLHLWRSAWPQHEERLI